MDRLLAAIPAGVQAEVYHIKAEHRSVMFRAGELAAANARSREGFALRLVADGRIGFATANTVADPRRLVEKAMACAQFGPAAAFAFPAQQVAPFASVDQRLIDLSSQDLADIGRQTVARIREYDPDFIISAGVSTSAEEVNVRNTAGGGGQTRRTVLDVSCGGELVRGDDILNIFATTASGRREIDIDGLCDRSFGLLARAKKVVPAGAGVMPILMTPKVLAQTVLPPSGAAFSGKSVLQKVSPLESRVGQQLFDSRLSIVDDPLVVGGPASAGIDDEGVAGRRTSLVDSGVVKGFIWDLQTAGLAGQSSTGSGRKVGRTSGAGLNSLPAPTFSNTMVAPGQTPFWDLVKSMKSGLIIDSVSGTPGFNPGGEFSVTIQVGYRVENGEIVGRVKNAMCAGNVFTMLNGIADMAKEADWLAGESGALSIPAILFSGLRVVSK